MGLTEEGQKLGKLYSQSKAAPVDANAFTQGLKNALIDRGYAAEMAGQIDSVVANVLKQAKLNLAGGKSTLTMDQLHNIETAARTFGLKQKGFGEVGGVTSSISKDIAQLVGGFVDSQVPEAIPSARMYRALATALDIADESKGVFAGLRGGGITSQIVNTLKAILEYPINLASQGTYNLGKYLSPATSTKVAPPLPPFSVEPTMGSIPQFPFTAELSALKSSSKKLFPNKSIPTAPTAPEATHAPFKHPLGQV